MFSRLQARHDGVKILVALVVGLEQLFGHAGLVERLLGLVGKTFAVGGLVVEDGDVLALVVLGDVVAGDRALLVVAAADARHVPELALGEQRVGRGRRDLQHVAVGIGFRGRDRRRRAIMAGDERNLRAADLFGDRARLLRIAGIVLDIQRELLAEQAAGGVEIRHRLFGAVLHLPAERGFAAGHRARDGDGDVLRQLRAAVDSASDAPNARPMSFNDFMRGPRGIATGSPAGRVRKSRSLSADFTAKSSAIFGHVAALRRILRTACR